MGFTKTAMGPVRRWLLGSMAVALLVPGTLGAALPTQTFAVPDAASTTVQASTPALTGAIGHLYNTNAWARSVLLRPTGAEECSGSGSNAGCVQRFAGGDIAWSARTGARVVVNGPVRTSWWGADGPAGFHGYPATDTASGLRNGGSKQSFERGTITYSPATGAQRTGGSIHLAWGRSGFEGGFLGYPVTGESTGLRDGGAWQAFERGFVVWSPATGAHPSMGAIRERWRRTGMEEGELGYPATDEALGLKSGGSSQEYQRGTIIWSPATGAKALTGAIRSYWSSTGGQNGALGYPVGEEVRQNNFVYQLFQGGTVYWSAATGAHSTTHGDVHNRYNSLGGAAGQLGLPLTDKLPRAGGLVQQFANGWLVWGPATGARIVGHPTYKVWSITPGEFGWPVKDTWTDGRGAHVAFQKLETIWNDATEELYSAEAVDASTAVFLGDSQLDMDSWGEQGARAAGYPRQVVRSIGGIGYVSGSPAVGGGSATDALAQDRILLPQGNPGLVVVTLGGNDARIGATDAAILSQANRLWDELRRKYPRSTILINGVLSRYDASHAQRRWVDGLVTREAALRGWPRISMSGTATIAGAAGDYLDGAHMNQTGHNKVAPLYASAIKYVLGK
ncbi:GDSL-type esterase/lipase family protein [Arthrobacter sp. AK01]|uniref:GDSL-type esterase/lipase family protein n=1 Tax=Arthrobacter sp. AK01 TaxID=2894084 RepID=UPI001E47B9DA|nr:GDSL-type esterase/lipase family protein [Arthrobacter sp. AK01]MCD4851660.1 GDSL-type esterase/lipase family protein [Arthrobacter sp. AK01]